MLEEAVVSVMIDRKRERAIIKVQRRDRLYGTGKTYLTSISVDLVLFDLVLRIFGGDRCRMSKWIAQRVGVVDERSLGSREGGAGFSRLMQREMIRLIEKRARIEPLPSDGGGALARGVKRSGGAVRAMAVFERGSEEEVA